MKSKSKISKQIEKKRHSILVETIIVAKKHEGWLNVASILAGPIRRRINFNLDEINKNTKEGEIVIIPGKVLSQGEINKKITIIALNFSEKAREKLLKSKTIFSTIREEIEKNPGAKNTRVLLK